MTLGLTVSVILSNQPCRSKPSERATLVGGKGHQPTRPPRPTEPCSIYVIAKKPRQKRRAFQGSSPANCERRGLFLPSDRAPQKSNMGKNDVGIASQANDGIYERFHRTLKKTPTNPLKIPLFSPPPQTTSIPRHPLFISPSSAYIFYSGDNGELRTRISTF